MKAEFSILTILILLGIVLVVFISFFGKLYAKQDNVRAAKICEQSVEAHIAMRIDGLEFESELICPTRYRVIKEKDDEKTKEIIANYMYDCWTQFKAGTRELFYGKDYHFCHVCDHLIFRDTKRKPISGFADYVQDNTIPNGDISYAEYFNKYGGKDPDSSFIREDIKKLGDTVYNDKINIEPDKPYAIVFSYVKGRHALEQYLRELAHTGVGASVSIVGMGVMKLGALASASVVGSAVGVPLIIVGGVMTVGGLVYAAVVSSIDKADPQWAAFIELREYNSEEIAKRGCQNMPIRRR